MKSLIIAGAKTGAMYLLRKYAASIVFDLIFEAAEKIAKKTDTQIDDNAVAAMKSDKSEIINAIKAAI